MATYGANDALYGTGTFGTARYGRVTPIIAVSGVVGTSAVGTVEVKPTEALESAVGTGAIGTVEVQINTTISSVVGTSALGAVTKTAISAISLTGVQGTSAFGATEAQIDTSISGLGSTGSIGTTTQSAPATVMGAFNPDIASFLFSLVAFATTSITSKSERLAAVEGVSLTEQNVASSRAISQLLSVSGSSGTTNETLALTGDDQVEGSIQGAVGTGQAGALSTSATVFDYEAVKELYSRRRTVFIARAA